MSKQSRSFPEFIKREANRVADAPEGMNGYLFEGAGGEQIVFWENRKGGYSPPAVHGFWEYALVVEGTFTGKVGGKIVRMNPGDEIAIPPGVEHDGTYSPDYRAIDAFGGRRVRRVTESRGKVPPSPAGAAPAHGVRDEALSWEMYRTLSYWCEYLVGACWQDGERPVRPVYRQYQTGSFLKTDRRLMPDRADRYSYVSALVVRALLARYELSETKRFPAPHDSERVLVDVARAFCDGVVDAQNPDGTVHLFWQDPAKGKKDNWNFDTCGGGTILQILLRTLPHVDPERAHRYVDAAGRFLAWVKDWERDGVMLLGPYGATKGGPDYSRNPYVTCSGCLLALLADWYSVTGDETYLPMTERLLANLANHFYRDDGSCGGKGVCFVTPDKPIDLKAPDHFGDMFYIDDGVVRALQAIPTERIPEPLLARVARHVEWLNAARSGAYWPLAGPTFEGRQHGFWINAKTVQMGGLLWEMNRVTGAGVLTERDREAMGRFLVDPDTIAQAGLMQETNRNAHSYEATGAAAGTLATLLGASLYRPASSCDLASGS